MPDEHVALDQEAADGFKRFRLGALMYLALALVCASLAAYAYRLENPSAIVAQARVTGFEKLGSEERVLVLTEFVDAQGRTRTTRDNQGMVPGARIGDIVPVVYSADSDWARVVNGGERAMRTAFILITAFVLLLALVFLVAGLRQRATRRRLVREGRVERGQAIRIDERRLPFANMPPEWRVSASWLDPATATWREVRSAWQSSLQWRPPAKGRSVLIYVDPANPNSAWLPVYSLREAIA